MVILIVDGGGFVAKKTRTKALVITNVHESSQRQTESERERKRDSERERERERFGSVTLRERFHSATEIEIIPSFQWQYL